MSILTPCDCSGDGATNECGVGQFCWLNLECNDVPWALLPQLVGIEWQNRRGQGAPLQVVRSNLPSQVEADTSETFLRLLACVRQRVSGLHASGHRTLLRGRKTLGLFGGTVGTAHH